MPALFKEAALEVCFVQNICLKWLTGIGFYYIRDLFTDHKP